MGNPFVHLDLAADDLAAAKKFYKSVFDWKFRDMPEMNWSGIDVGKGTGGGIGGKNMPDQPTAWTAYVEVASVKKAIEKAAKAGAQIIVPYQEVGAMGALGIFVDPQGATLGVWETRPAPKARTAPARKAASRSKAKKAKKPAKRR